jgi:hypothetical protein
MVFFAELPPQHQGPISILIGSFGGEENNFSDTKTDIQPA